MTDGCTNLLCNISWKFHQLLSGQPVRKKKAGGTALHHCRGSLSSSQPGGPPCWASPLAFGPLDARLSDINNLAKMPVKVLRGVHVFMRKHGGKNLVAVKHFFTIPFVSCDSSSPAWIYQYSFHRWDYINQGLTKRCRLSWLTNSALVYEPKCKRERGGCGVSVSTAVQMEPK
jgi:hypothetical protein